MRVLHAVRGMAYSSGPTHCVVALTEGQARQGHDVTLYYVDIDDTPNVEPDPTLVKSRRFSITGPFRGLGYSVDFRNAMRDSVRDFDIVHVHAIWNYPTYNAMRTAAKADVPFVVAPHGSFEGWALRRHRLKKWPWVRLMEGPLFHRAAAMSALTEAEARQIRDFGIGAPIFVSPNGTALPGDVSTSEPDYHDNTLKSDTFTFLFLSRIHEKKGLDILAAALGRLRQHASDWRVLIAGDDAGSGYMDKVKAFFAKEGLGDRCEFLGEVKGQRKQAALEAADVFVLSSYSEGLPVAVLEAMTAGLPVVITPGCNLPEVAEAGAGLIAQPEPSAIVEALSTLLQNEKMREDMGKRARLLVEQKFTWEMISKRMLKAYQNILDNKDVNCGLK